MKECVVLANLIASGFEAVYKNTVKQNKFNHRVAVFSVLVTAYIIAQHAKIEKLSYEVKELKRATEE